MRYEVVYCRWVLCLRSVSIRSNDFWRVCRHYHVRFDAQDVSVSIRRVRMALKSIHNLNAAFRASSTQVRSCTVTLAHPGRFSTVRRARCIRLSFPLICLTIQPICSAPRTVRVTCMLMRASKVYPRYSTATWVLQLD